MFANLADFLPKVTVHQRRKPFWLDSILNEISVKALIPEVISIKGQLTQLSLVTYNIQLELHKVTYYDHQLVAKLC